jgi:hypothetical protein
VEEDRLTSYLGSHQPEVDAGWAAAQIPSRRPRQIIVCPGWIGRSVSVFEDCRLSAPAVSCERLFGTERDLEHNREHKIGEYPDDCYFCARESRIR